jgi:hypothetical protein
MKASNGDFDAQLVQPDGSCETDVRGLGLLSSRERLPPWSLGLMGLGIAVGLALRLLIPYGMDPAIFVTWGDDSSAHTSYVLDRLGSPPTRPSFAHDGKYFFVQANDPWYLDPHRHAALLDHPVYRAQRMLYPLLASGGGVLPAGFIVWLLLITNVLAMAIGTWIGGKLAVMSGLPSWLGLTVPLNIGILFELEIGGAGIVAYLFCLLGIYSLRRNSVSGAAMWFVAAALTKEVMLAFAVGVFVVRRLDRGRACWRLVTWPALAVVVWHLYVTVRLSGLPEARSDAGALSPPFVGILEALRFWVTEPRHLLINLLILGIVAMFVPIAVRRRSDLAWGALPFVGLSLVLSPLVWRETFDLTRALTPVFTAIPFVVIVPRRDAGVPGEAHEEFE